MQSDGMTDRLTPAQRSLVMSHIRSRDTKPEMAVRRMLHAMGFRYRLHRRDLPGTPDIVLPRRKAIILVNGCFFHGHECASFRWPDSNRAFWQEKIRRNRERDAATSAALMADGWRVLTVWGCALKGPRRLDAGRLAAILARFILGTDGCAVLSGQDCPEVPAPP
jgi:DNA mismatch endonuclease (patch repair protein)